MFQINFEDAREVEAYLGQHERKELLRFLTCGSVDDGKSTLIGRLLHDTKMIYEDQLLAAKKDTERYGTTGGEVDLALVTDGLEAEREQGITIDVAYRYFSTERRKYIIADTPGHEQYTRNMATGASTCELAIILVDASKGILEQTRRHSYIGALLGIRHLVVAVNKMDRVDFDEACFNRIRDDYLQMAASLGKRDITFIPLSALKGDNVVDRSVHMPWYHGPTLLEHLDTVDIAHDVNLEAFRLPVQYVNRPNSDFRGFAGTIVSGEVRPGDEVLALPSGKRSRVTRLVTYDGDLTSGIPGQAVTLTLADEIDISRGDMLVSPDHLPMVSSRLQARLVWMSEHALETGKEYLFRFGNLTVPGNVEKIEHRVDMSTLEQMPADALEMNGIGEVVVQLSRRVPFDLYSRIRETGAFIMIDRMTNATLSAGMVSGMLEDTSLARVANDVRPVTGVERQDRNGHTALVVALRGACAAEAAVKMERVLFDRHGLVIRLDVSGQSLSETEAQALLARSAGMVLLMVDPAENAGADLSFQLSTLDDLNAAMNTLLSRL